MSKEVLSPAQFARVNLLAQDQDIKLSQAQLDELNALYDETLSAIKPSQLVKGTIVKIDSDGVLVDIGYKSDGLIPNYEFSKHELKELQPGGEIEVILDELESVDGNVILSYEKAKALRAWEKITKLFEDGKPVEGQVTHRVKGGLNVDIGIPAFLPGSQVDVQRVTDFDQYVGQTITAEIIKLNKKRGNVIVSRRRFLNAQRAESRKKVLDTLVVDSVVQGVVKNITNYGVFVDIGGVDGLLHITDMTWGRIAHPSELVKIGDTITVKVLTIDKENNKISLGMKQLSENPWQEIAKTVKVGEKIKGKISSITDYGLFVEVAKGVEGLVHISEVSWTNRIADLRKFYKVGDEIEALITSFDEENRRMSLSVKQLEKNPWETVTEQFKVGDKIKGTISNITDFGVFVQLSPGIDGLVHISDLSWTEHIEHPGDLYSRGQEVEAVVLSIDQASKKISLGIKQLTTDPWQTIDQEYPVGSMVDGKVTKITTFGAFVKLPNGVEGLVHVSELQDGNAEKMAQALPVGTSREFRVVNINKDERKLGLSMKEHGPVSAPRPSAPRAAKKKAEPVIKQKSQMQLELERHMGTAQDEDKD